MNRDPESLTPMSSLSRFKEALKPCSQSSSFFSGADTAASQSSSSFSGADTAASQSSAATGSPPRPLRKPPKSTLSQQLQRLDLPASAKRPPRPPKPREEESESDDYRPPLTPAAPAVRDPFRAAPAGPFEPLILSDPGESPVIQVPASINCRLLEHQRHGVRFMYSLYRNNHGGVLGDDMGLGKTIQTIAFLAAVIAKDVEHGEYQMEEDHMLKKGPVLVVCPTSVIHNWENEFSDWANFSVAVYHGTSRDLILERLEAGGVDILITSFDSFRIYDTILSSIRWEIVIVDEAHRLKNEKSRLYSSFLGIITKKRFGLTGTIMQNKIMELFNLFDWVAPGSLGTREHFKEYYDEPLKHGQRLNAPERFIRVADQRKQHLATVLQKYLLRRTKEETIGHLMLGKEDNIVLCAMTDLQKRVYKRMLEQPDFQCLLNKDLPCSCGSPLTQVECCKRIVPNGIIWSYLHRDKPDGCDSCPFCLVLPCLVKLQQISNHLELIKPNPKDDKEKQKKDAELASAVFDCDIELVGGSAQNESFMGLSDVEFCGKMRALEKLILSWTSNGDKILLFSYSVRMLDILEKFLIRKGYCFSRLDGSTPMNLRQSLVDEFNRSPSKQVFLISTRAGGLGLNLVSANRVVIFDPNWNPAQDLQAQDRSFRFGQTRHVIVFRLLGAGTLEELIYSRQVYKQQLSNIAVSGKMERRYFHGVQDCKEFKGELFGICNLFRDLSDKLFTNEIFESHVNDGEEYGHLHATETVGEHEMGPAIQTVLASENLVDHCDMMQTNAVSCLSKSNRVTKENESRRDDLGIVYAHRNEDVVNMGPGFQGKEEASMRIIDYIRTNISRADRGEGMNDVLQKGKPLCKEEKLNEFKRFAEYMGMGVLEFSKWLLSASPSVRDEMLQNYKKKKKKKREKYRDDG